MKRLFMMIMTSILVTASLAQNINKAEYFFDHDPGQGNGTVIPISTPGDVVNFPANITLGGLPTGFHTLAIRVCDIEGKWSRFDYRTIYMTSEQESNVNSVVAAEYFFDSDPGTGNATPTSVGTFGAVVNFTAAIPANLSPGFHWLGIRTKDSDGKWGLYERRQFYLTGAPVDMTAVTGAEYFFDADPGPGNGLPLTFTSPAYTVSQTFSIPIPSSMSGGPHWLTMRVKDQQGNWSLFEKDSINVGNAAAIITCPANVTATAQSGQCTAVVNGLDPTVSPSGTNYNYTLTGATTGSGIGSASGHTFNAGVTTVTYGIATAPAISCSFTVTVNTNAAPSVTISASQTNICAGTLVTFNPTPTNGGSNPTYVWLKNEIVVGTGPTYQSSTLAWGDYVYVVMTSSLACANPTVDTSGFIQVFVYPATPPTATILASQTSICQGTQVHFFAQTSAANASYQWKRNGVNFGPNAQSFFDTTMNNNDSITVTITTPNPCPNSSTATSAPVVFSVTPSVTPVVTISASQTTICPGQQVTFTANPVNGGSTPTYNWVVNHTSTGVTGSSFQTSSLQNGDTIFTYMNSTAACYTISMVVSNSIFMNVNSAVSPSVAISANQTSICNGTQVTFNATPANGGISPSYVWKVNGNNVGTGSSYQSSTLANNDVVTAVMTSSLACASPTTATSNAITMAVSSAVTPTVSISATSTNICSGTNVTFSATVAGGGANPGYQWKLNGQNVGSNSSSYSNSNLHDGDLVSVVVTSSLACANPNIATSNVVTIHVQSAVTPYVHITASSIDICEGDYVTFTATCNDPNPTYQWKLNGADVGSNYPTYGNGALAQNDTIKVVMTSSMGCATSATVTSNAIFMDVSQYVAASVTITTTQTSICPGQQVTFHATPTNGGNPNYEWTVNNTLAGTNSDSLQISTLQNDDLLKVTMTSSLGCVSPAQVIDTMSVSVNQNCGPSTNVPVLNIKTYPAKEGDVGLTTLNVVVTLDTIATSPVSVNYATSNDDAIAGLDYLATNGVLTIPVGASSGTIQLQVIGDLLRESNENFWLNFSNPVNVVLQSDPRSRIMIIDDDKGKNNHTVNVNETVPVEVQKLKIPTVARRNQVWMIPEIGKFENEISILNIQGELVNRFVNYRNQQSVGNLAAGLYFYQVSIKQTDGNYRFYTGRLLITE